MGVVYNRFDEQSATYDERVGLPAGVGRDVAGVAIELAAAGSQDLVVEIGAGTGQIGVAFARSPVRYLGFDLSWAMLDVFKRKLRATGDAAILIQADGGRRWPVANRSARIIFAARVAHQLPADHVRREVLRVACDRAVFLIGRVERPADCLQARMRGEMQRRLRLLGLTPGAADAHRDQLLGGLCQDGARRIRPTAAARWTATGRPLDLLRQWSGKAGLGGRNLPAAIKKTLLEDLRDWADGTFGGPGRRHKWEEAFVLSGVRLPCVQSGERVVQL